MVSCFDKFPTNPALAAACVYNISFSRQISYLQFGRRCYPGLDRFDLAAVCRKNGKKRGPSDPLTRMRMSWFVMAMSMGFEELEPVRPVEKSCTESVF
jgi:hypothetical protein